MFADAAAKEKSFLDLLSAHTIPTFSGTLISILDIANVISL